MRPAGDAKQLEINISRKTYRSADGAPAEIFRAFACALDAGRLTAILGPSGSGKTTFLRIVAGLDGDYAGAVSLAGAQRIGFVFQEPRLLPWRTLEQNVRIAAPMATDKTVASIFDRLRLTEHARLYPGELSLGLARRAAIARALAIEPDLLILDEPFVSLDPPMAAALRADLGALVRERALTAIMVSHAVDEALALADRALVFSGRPVRLIGDLDLAQARRLGQQGQDDARRVIDALLAEAAVEGIAGEHGRLKRAEC